MDPTGPRAQPVATATSQHPDLPGLTTGPLLLIKDARAPSDPPQR